MNWKFNVIKPEWLLNNGFEFVDSDYINQTHFVYRYRPKFGELNRVLVYIPRDPTSEKAEAATFTKDLGVTRYKNPTVKTILKLKKIVHNV
jgi:hypothetical protein